MPTISCEWRWFWLQNHAGPPGCKAASGPAGTGRKRLSSALICLHQKIAATTIACPYCQGAVEYDTSGQSLVISARTPLRYSRAKMELRARDYGSQKTPPDLAMTPERWVAEEKLMPGALQGYVYMEDGKP